MFFYALCLSSILLFLGHSFVDKRLIINNEKMNGPIFASILLMLLGYEFSDSKEKIK